MFKKPLSLVVVMPGLVPGIHVFPYALSNKTWMAGTSPAMTGHFCDGLVEAAASKSGHRLLRIGIFMSSILISRTGSLIAQATFGSTLTRK